MNDTLLFDGNDERERLLIEAVVTLARTLRDERDRLAERLREVESELLTLTSRLDSGQPESSPAESPRAVNVSSESAGPPCG